MSAYTRPYLLVLLFVLLSSPAQGQTAAQPAPSVIGSRAEIMTWSDPLEALGTLRADESVTLSATVTDIVAEINFEDGAQVEQGQVLIRLDDAEEQAQLRSALAISDERSNTLGRTIQLQERNLAVGRTSKTFKHSFVKRKPIHRLSKRGLPTTKSKRRSAAAWGCVPLVPAHW